MAIVESAVEKSKNIVDSAKNVFKSGYSERQASGRDGAGASSAH